MVEASAAPFEELRGDRVEQLLSRSTIQAFRFILVESRKTNALKGARNLTRVDTGTGSDSGISMGSSNPAKAHLVDQEALPQPPAIRFVTTYLAILVVFAFAQLVLLTLDFFLAIGVDGDYSTANIVALYWFSVPVYILVAQLLHRGYAKGRILFLFALPLVVILGHLTGDELVNPTRLLPFILLGGALLLTWEAETFLTGKAATERRPGEVIARLPTPPATFWIGLCAIAIVAMMVFQSRYSIAYWWILLGAGAWVIARHSNKRVQPIGWALMALFLIVVAGLFLSLPTGIL